MDQKTKKILDFLSLVLYLLQTYGPAAWDYITRMRGMSEEKIDSILAERAANPMKTADELLADVEKEV